tara:strand:- start:694 stop:831 length:138 start_codon:yes stop_codon:yes gene_type:complete
MMGLDGLAGMIVRVLTLRHGFSKLSKIKGHSPEFKRAIPTKVGSH